MSWVLKRTESMWRFFLVSKTHVLNDAGLEYYRILTLQILLIWDNSFRQKAEYRAMETENCCTFQQLSEPTENKV